MNPALRVVLRSILVVWMVIGTLGFVQSANAQEKQKSAPAQVRIEVGKDGSVKVYDMQGNLLRETTAKPETDVTDTTKKATKGSISSSKKGADAKPEGAKADLKEDAESTEKGASRQVESGKKGADAKPEGSESEKTESGKTSNNVEGAKKSPDKKPQEEKKEKPEIEPEPNLPFANSAVAANLTLYTGTGSNNSYTFTSSTNVLTVNVSVQNDGTSSSTSFRIGFYLSTDIAISTGDFLIGSSTVASLTNGFFLNSSLTVDLDNFSSLPFGTYYAAFIFDDLFQISETNEDDNAWYFTTPFTYGSTTPNLTNYTGSGSNNTFSFDTSTNDLSVSISIVNDGTAASGSFRAGFYLSTNTTITTSDFLVVSSSETSLANGFFRNRTVNVDLDNVSGLPSGTYYVAFIIDDLFQVSESNENDNAFYFPSPQIFYPGLGGTPNLAVYTGSGSNNTYTFSTSTNILSVNASVTNTGTAPSGSFRTGYYLSLDQTIGTLDNLVASSPEASLTNGLFRNVSTTVDLDSVSGLAAGTYFVGVFFDDQNQISEPDENDNKGVYQPPITYTQPPAQPNLKIYTGNGSNNTYSYNTSTSVLTVNASVENNGGSSSGSFRIGYYLSLDQTIGTSDFLFSSTAEASLTNGFFRNVTAAADLDNVSYLPAGTYYPGVFIDDQSQVTESNENDNRAFYTPQITYNPIPCLVASRVECPSPMQEGAQFTVSVFVNMGGCPSPNNLLGSFTSKLTWNAAHFSYVSHSGLLTGFTGAVNTNNVGSGILDFNGANPSGTGGDVKLLTITFKVIGTNGATGVFDLDFSAMSAAISFTNLLPSLTIADCSYQIIGGCICGDVNEDGVVNSTDCLIILSYDAGITVPPAFLAKINQGCADLNLDGVTNSTDALICLTCDAGLPQCPSRVGKPGGCK